MEWSLTPNQPPETSKQQSKPLPRPYSGFSHQCHITYMEYVGNSFIPGSSGCKDHRKYYNIESNPVCRQRWMTFYKQWEYSLKSGYQVEQVYPVREKTPPLYGPTVTALKAFYWKVCCPPKIKHFLWQLVSGCISGKKNLHTRGIQGYICCARCGNLEETVNHVFFECLPTVQVWALSQIPTNPKIFPTNALFTNMDHLYWRISLHMEDHQFACISWYIWKERNDKVFSNIDMDPKYTLKLI